MPPKKKDVKETKGAASAPPSDAAEDDKPAHPKMKPVAFRPVVSLLTTCNDAESAVADDGTAVSSEHFLQKLKENSGRTRGLNEFAKGRLGALKSSSGPPDASTGAAASAEGDGHGGADLDEVTSAELAEEKFVQFYLSMEDISNEIERAREDSATGNAAGSERLMHLIAQHEATREEDKNSQDGTHAPGTKPRMPYGCELTSLLIKRIMADRHAAVEADEASKMSITIDNKSVLRADCNARVEEATAELEKAETASMESSNGAGAPGVESVSTLRKNLMEHKDTLSQLEREYRRAVFLMSNKQITITSIFVLVDVVKNDDEVVELVQVHRLPLNLCLFQKRDLASERTDVDLSKVDSMDAVLYDMCIALSRMQKEPTTTPSHALSGILVATAYSSSSDMTSHQSVDLAADSTAAAASSADNADTEDGGLTENSRQETLEIMMGNVTSQVFESAMTYVRYLDWKKKVKVYTIPQTAFPATAAVAKTDVDAGDEKPSLMTKLLDSVPNESCSPAVILHAMIEECCSSCSVASVIDEVVDGGASTSVGADAAATATDVSEAAQYIESAMAGVDDLSLSSSTNRLMVSTSGNLNLSASLSASIPIPSALSPGSVSVPLLNVDEIEERYARQLKLANPSKTAVTLENATGVSPLSCRPHAGLVTELAAAVSAAETAMAPPDPAEDGELGGNGGGDDDIAETKVKDADSSITLQQLLRYIAQVSAVNAMRLASSRRAATMTNTEDPGQEDVTGRPPSRPSALVIDGDANEDISGDADECHDAARIDILSRRFYDVLSASRCRDETSNAAGDYENHVIVRDDVNSNLIYGFFASPPLHANDNGDGCADTNDYGMREERFGVPTLPTLSVFHERFLKSLDDHAHDRATPALSRTATPGSTERRRPKTVEGAGGHDAAHQQSAMAAMAAGDFFDLTPRQSLLGLEHRYDYSIGGGVVLQLSRNLINDEPSANARYRGLTVGLRKAIPDHAPDETDNGNDSSGPYAVLGTTSNGCAFRMQTHADGEVSLQCSAPNGDVVHMFSNGSVVMHGSCSMSPPAATPTLARDPVPLTERGEGCAASSYCVLLGGIVFMRDAGTGGRCRLLYPDGTSAECKSNASSPPSSSSKVNWRTTFADGACVSVAFASPTRMQSLPDGARALYEAARSAREAREASGAHLSRPLSVSTATDPDSEACVFTREDLACFVHYTDGRTLSNWLADCDARISRVPDVASCVELGSLPKVRQHDVISEAATDATAKVSVVSVELMGSVGLYVEWDSLTRGFTIRCGDTGSVVYSRRTVVAFQASTTSMTTTTKEEEDVQHEEEERTAATAAGAPPAGTVLFDMMTGDVITQGGRTQLEAAAVAVEQSFGSDPSADGAAPKANADGDDTERVSGDGLNADADDGNALEGEVVAAQSEGAKEETDHVEGDGDGEDKSDASAGDDVQAKVEVDAERCTNSEDGAAGDAAGDDVPAVGGSSAEEATATKLMKPWEHQRYVPPRVFFVEEDGSGVELLHADVFQTLCKSSLVTGCGGCGADGKGVRLMMDKPSMAAMEDDVIGIGEDGVISYTFMDTANMHVGGGSMSAAEADASEPVPAASTMSSRRLKNKVEGSSVPEARTAAQALPALQQPSRLRTLQSELAGDAKALDDTHVLVPLPRIAAAFMQRSEMEEEGKRASACVGDVCDGSDGDGDDEGGAADAEKLESIIKREIVCFPQRSLEKTDTLNGVCDWHSRWRQDLADAQLADSASSTPSKAPPGSAALSRHQSSDDADEFGLVVEPTTNTVAQSETLQADTALVAQKIVEMRQHRGGSAGQVASSKLAQEKRAEQDPAAAAACESVHRQADRPKMKRPVIRDPGPSRPMAGFTLKYFDSFEYQKSAEAVDGAQTIGSVAPAEAADPCRGREDDPVSEMDGDSELLDGYVNVKREANSESYEFEAPRQHAGDGEAPMRDANDGDNNGNNDGDSIDLDDDAVGDSVSGRNMRYINIERDTRRALHTVSANAIASRGLEQQFVLHYDRLASPSRHGTLGATGLSALGDFDIGEISKGSIGRRTMTLHNVSHEGGRFSVILPRLPLRAVYNPGIVAAGLAVPITMELDTSDLPMNSFFQQTVIIKTEMHVFNVKVIADIVEKPNKKFAAMTKKSQSFGKSHGGGAAGVESSTAAQRQRERVAQERLSKSGRQLRPMQQSAVGGMDDDVAAGLTLDPNRTLQEVLGARDK